MKRILYFLYIYISFIFYAFSNCIYQVKVLEKMFYNTVIPLVRIFFTLTLNLTALGKIKLKILLFVANRLMTIIFS